MTNALFTQYGCGCPSADVCSDPATWGRVNEPVDVIGPDPDCDEEAQTWRIRYADGTEAHAFPDELDPPPTM